MLQSFFQNRVAVLCAFCRSPRHVYKKKRIGFSEILASSICAIIVMGIVHQTADARVFIYFVALLAVAELFIVLRWRLAIRCPHCGFDPLVYAKDTEEAARRVRVHLDKRKNNVDMLLARPLNLPKRRPENTKTPHHPSQKPKSTGRRLNKKL